MKKKILEVDMCSLKGRREENVIVDIGVGNRNYTGETNELGQLIKVEAKEIFLQSTKEKLTKDGRYCNDEAKVEGTKFYHLDEGHIIADSLGGVSNAYNIVPMHKNVNRRGGEYYDMEKYIRKCLRDKKRITDFECEIMYSNKTQIPDKFIVLFKVDGKYEKAYIIFNK